jgi:hypothetical protein
LSAPDGAVIEAWLENMAMCFSLHDYTSNMKVHMVVFQLKGSALLWWKTLLPQLNMAVEDVSWELFEEWFWERTRASGSVQTHYHGRFGQGPSDSCSGE